MHPCVPSPCGPNSICRENPNGQAICTCLENYIGSPPSCKPECTVNYECPNDRTCEKNRCTNPCPSICGENAECRVISHSITCNCPENTEGDPFYRCTPRKQEDPINICDTSPCGFNAECFERNGVGSCQCIKEHFGDPYVGCRPECVASSECLLNQACVNNKCINPCLGVCGVNSECKVINHVPSCNCIQGYQGNAFDTCVKFEEPPATQRNDNPCHPSPCGPNAQCKVINNNQPVCSCDANFIGSPPNCRPECTVSTECADNLACIDLHCKSPCVDGICGHMAECTVQKHRPLCKCRPGTNGNKNVFTLIM
jgi:hypothetical protein